MGKLDDIREILLCVIGMELCIITIFGWIVMMPTIQYMQAVPACDMSPTEIMFKQCMAARGITV